MKTKLEMAHEYAMVILSNPEYDEKMETLIKYSWIYADAMQAEADKRKSSEFPNVLRGACGEIVAVKVDDMEWQPDWSQAPEWAKWWVATANQSGKITGGWFYEDKPEFGLRDNPSAYISVGCRVVLTDSFGYTGNWRNSLRKRPK